MKLIPLEEVKNQLDRLGYYFDSKSELKWMKFKMESLPTIDPIATIDEMIEEDYIPPGQPWNIKEGILEELKSRLLITQK